MRRTVQRIKRVYRWVVYRVIFALDRLTKRITREPVPNEFAKILLIEMQSIGDVIVVTPAIRAIKERYSTANITMLVHSNSKEVVIGNPHVDTVLYFESPKTIIGTLKIIREMKKRNFEIAISLSPCIKNSLFVLFAGTKYRVGYLNDYRKKLSFYNDHMIEARGFYFPKIVVYKRYEHLIERGAKSLRPLEIEVKDKRLELNRLSKAILDIDNWFNNLHILKDDLIISIHPFASWKYKCWPKSKFIFLLKLITKKYKAKIFIIGGRADKEESEAISKEIKKDILIASGMSLQENAEIIRRSVLFIGNDSAPLHMASAFGIPIIGLYGPSDPLTTGPLGNGNTLLRKPVMCSPCGQEICIHREENCMDLITVEEVFEAAEKIIDRSSSIMGVKLARWMRSSPI